MSRYCDYDDYDGDVRSVLNYGRWERNARAVLKSKRGRKALAELREALMALPEHRLVASAMCTVGGVDARLPAMTDDEVAAYRAGYNAQFPEFASRMAENMRQGREDERAEFGRFVERMGEGVCINGALLWHRKVKAGMDPAEAFATLPTLWDGDDEGDDQLEKTAKLAKSEAGLTFTLAWELAYRNDETYWNKTPEDRWAAFVAWIDKQLAEPEATQGRAS